MDDRELEARLRTYLRRRFDGTAAPADLRSSVEESLATEARLIGKPRLRFLPDLRIGLAVGAAAVLLVVALLANAPLHRLPIGQASPSPSVATPPSGRTFMVLPPGAAVPSKSDSLVASDVLAARLRTLGLGTFVSHAGFAITFELPAGDAPSDDVIRSTLAAAGDVAFVPLPPADYGDANGGGRLVVTVGQPLPMQEPALFGREGIASADWDDGSPAALTIKLTPAAAQLVADWSAAHVGEIVAILVDSKVLAAPIVREAITTGAISLDPATTAPPPADGVAALIGGSLPAAWRPVEVIEPLTRDQAVNAALSQGPGTVESADLDAQVMNGNWRAIWTVVLRGAFPYHCRVPIGPIDTECGSHPGARITVDGIGGNVIAVEFLSE